MSGEQNFESNFQKPRGTFDILPDQRKYYRKLLRVTREIADFYRFSRIETPIIEKAKLFTRGVGEATEVVEKQMYTLKVGGKKLALRPEGTASVARAYIGQGMKSWSKPVKLWYFGPFFRHERPQAGRYRQFWQLGFEILGKKSPVLDAQTIQITSVLLDKLKFEDLIIKVNSIGCSQCRPKAKELLRDYFEQRKKSLCADCRRRLKQGNVFRILDCKEEKCRRIVKGAPQIIEHLCKSCHNHFKEVLEFLDQLGLEFRLDPYLVRGLDYYTNTVFEVFSKSRPDSSLIGGGRYDRLIEVLGGESTPGVGMAGGAERIIQGMKEHYLRYKQDKVPEVFLAQVGKKAKRKALKLLEEFREAGVPIAESLDRDSLRAQLDIANNLGVKYVLILGRKELIDKRILVKNMETGKQRMFKLEDLPAKVDRLC